MILLRAEKAAAAQEMEHMQLEASVRVEVRPGAGARARGKVWIDRRLGLRQRTQCAVSECGLY